MRHFFCQQTQSGQNNRRAKRQQKGAQKQSARVIITVIDNSNSSNNNNKGHPGISSHICFSICRVKRTVIRLPFHFHLACQGCQRDVDRRVSSAHFLPSQLHSQPIQANRRDTLRWSTKSHINEIQMIGKNDMIHKRECHQAVMSALFPLLVCSGTPWACVASPLPSPPSTCSPGTLAVWLTDRQRGR